MSTQIDTSNVSVDDFNDSGGDGSFNNSYNNINMTDQGERPPLPEDLANGLISMPSPIPFFRALAAEMVCQLLRQWNVLPGGGAGGSDPGSGSEIVGIAYHCLDQLRPATDLRNLGEFHSWRLKLHLSALQCSNAQRRYAVYEANDLDRTAEIEESWGRLFRALEQAAQVRGLAAMEDLAAASLNEIVGDDLDEMQEVMAETKLS